VYIHSITKSCNMITGATHSRRLLPEHSSRAEMTVMAQTYVRVSSVRCVRKIAKGDD